MDYPENKKYQTEVGKNIEIDLIKLNMSRQALANLLEVSRPVVTNVINGVYKNDKLQQDILELLEDLKKQKGID